MEQLKEQPPSPPLEELHGNLREVLDIHFDAKWGSRYWIERAGELGIDVCREVQRIEQLDVLGLMEGRDLTLRSIWDFVPRRFHSMARSITVAETGGTLGSPRRTAYLEDEFRAAFVSPFLAAAGAFVRFPRGARWLWVGPTGPHIVGKAVRAVCREMDSPDPFSVDFDPRWYRAQAPGSLGRTRYLRHVVDQALDVLAREPVEVLFGTPPVVVALAERTAAHDRAGIQAVHLGGLPVLEADGDRLLELYPNAKFLSGYGNTLFGMCPQLEDRSLRAPRYYPHGHRLWIRCVSETPPTGCASFETVRYGERGRVLATRLDPGFLIVNLLERDTAIRIPPPAGRAIVEGFSSDGLETPLPGADVAPERIGIY